MQELSYDPPDCDWNETIPESEKTCFGGLFYRFKTYLIPAAAVLADLVQVLNKFLVFGLVVFGLGTAAVGANPLFIKQKDDKIHRLKTQLKDNDKTTASRKSENSALRSHKLNISEIKRSWPSQHIA